MINGSWDNIKKFYYTTFSIPPRVIDLLAVLPIIKMCASGIANQNIARYYGMDIAYVNDVTEEFLEFDGWALDLDINPYVLYNRCYGNMNKFLDDIYCYVVLPEVVDYEKAFHISEKVKSIEEEIKKFYGF